MELSKKSELTVGSVSYVIRTELTRDASPSIQTRVLGVDGAVVFQTSQDVSSLRPLFQNTQQVFTRLETQHQDVVKKLQDGHSPANSDHDAGGFKSLAGDETSEAPSFETDPGFETDPAFETEASSFEPETAEPDAPTFEPDPPPLEPDAPTFEHEAPTFEHVLPTFEPAQPPAAPPRSGGDVQGPDAETRALEECLTLLSGGDFEKATAQLRALLQTHPTCSEARELLEVTYKASSGARLPVDLVIALTSGMEAFATGRQREAIESWKNCLTEEPSNRRLQLLVLLSTTWSNERREHFANEVLSSSTNMQAGHPEETQALLLVAQTAENTSAAPVAAEVASTPAVVSAPPPPAPVRPAAVTPQTIAQDRDSFESLMADASSVVVITDEEPTPASVYPSSTGPSHTAPQLPSSEYAQDQDEPQSSSTRVAHRRN